MSRRVVDAGPTTCWTVIRAAGEGAGPPRDRFARCYAGPVRAWFAARWRQGRRRDDVEDAVQEVFVECFRAGGVLEQADEERPGGFRAFLYGVLRNVARRFEERGPRASAAAGAGTGPVELDALPADEPTLSRAFDRAWACSLLRQAAERQAELAVVRGPAALRRVDLLRARFTEGKPIRAIAEEWRAAAAELHHEYARARREFEEALRDVIRFHGAATAGDVERQCAGLSALLRD